MAFKKTIPFLVIPLIVGLSACGSGSGSTTASSTQAGGACKSGPGISDTEIKLGVTLPLSGSVASLGSEHLKAQEAFVEWVNSEGGINGRKLSLTSQDDAFNAQKAVTNAQYLIDQKKVFALWGDVGSAATSAVQTLTKRTGTPLLFPYSLSKSVTNPVDPNTFSIATPNVDQTEALSDYLAIAPEFKGKKIGFIVISSPDGAENLDGFKAGASKDNMVKVQTYDPGATSFKPQLVALKDSGAEVIFAAVNDIQYAKVLQEANDLGFPSSLKFIGSPATASDQPFVLAKSQVEGNYTIVFSALPSGTGKGIENMRDTLKKLKPDLVPGGFAVHAWTSGLILKEALTKAGTCINKDTVRESLESLKDFSTDDLVGPVTFSPAEHLGNASVRLMVAKDGQWQPASDYLFASKK